MPPWWFCMFVGGIDLFGLDAAAGILAQLHQPTARTIGRGGEHHAILVASEWNS